MTYAPAKIDAAERKIMAIDPGKKTGIVVYDEGRIVYHEALLLAPTWPEERLQSLYDSLHHVIAQEIPDVIVYEQPPVHGKVATRALVQYEAIILLVAAEAETPIHPCTPTAAKKVAAGFGGASKAQVREAVIEVFRELTTATEDECDAAALVLWALEELEVTRDVIG